MSQRMMGLLFDVESNTITYHLGEIYKSGELEQISTTRKIRVVQQEGTRNVNREIDHYNLDAIISVGYRVNSIRATQFRRWATQVLAQYTQKGYVIDRKRMENGAFLDEDYFEELLEEIREIRLSERRFYQKLRDVAVQEFWTYERELVKQGECTRDWTPEQIESIYNISSETGSSRKNGGAAIYFDKNGLKSVKKHGAEEVEDVYEVHQMLSVHEYPEYAGVYKNMQALARNNGEHLAAHKGNYQNATCWYYDCKNGNILR